MNQPGFHGSCHVRVVFTLLTSRAWSNRACLGVTSPQWMVPEASLEWKSLHPWNLIYLRQR